MTADRPRLGRSLVDVVLDVAGDLPWRRDDLIRAASIEVAGTATDYGRAITVLLTRGQLVDDDRGVIRRPVRPAASTDTLDRRIQAVIEADPDGNISTHAAAAGCPTRRVRAAVDRLGLRPGWLEPVRPPRAASERVSSTGGAQPGSGESGGQPSPRGSASGAPHGAGEPDPAGASPAPAAVVTCSPPPAARPADPPVDVARDPSGAQEPPAEAPEVVEPVDAPLRRRSPARDALVAYVAEHPGSTTQDIARALDRPPHNIPRDAHRAGLVEFRVEPMPHPLRWYPAGTTRPSTRPSTSPPPNRDEPVPATAAGDVLASQPGPTGPRSSGGSDGNEDRARDRGQPRAPVDPGEPHRGADGARRSAGVDGAAAEARGRDGAASERRYADGRRGVEVSADVPGPADDRRVALDVLARLRASLPAELREGSDEEVLGATRALVWVARGGR